MSQRKPFVGRRQPAADTKDQRRTTVQRRTSVTFHEALEHFVEAKRAEGVRDRTVKDYRQHAEYLARYLGGYDVLLSTLTASKVRAYINYLRTEKKRYEGVHKREGTAGISPTTINIRLKSLRTMSRWWFAEGYTASDFMRDVKPVLVDEPESLKGLKDGELDVLLASLDESYYAEWRDKVLIMLLLDTGLRPTEGITLKMTQVDAVRFVVKVPSQVAKNRHWREVPISREVVRAIQRLHDESTAYFGEHDEVFLNAYGEPLTPSAVRRRFNRIKNKLGLAQLTPQMFRHTFARNFILNGGDLFSLQRILDHADISTTRGYVTLDMDHIQEQHRKHSPMRRLFKRK